MTLKIYRDDERDPWYGKTNFVDDQGVVLGWDDREVCCEDVGWHIDHVEPQSFKAAIEPTDVMADDGTDPVELEFWRFDTTYFREFADNRESAEEGGAVVFRIVNARTHASAYIVLHNTHNGYYSHGFSFTKPDSIREGSL